MRYDLISPRPRKDGKTYWLKVGAGFPRDKGGFSLVFDALPLPDAEGRVTVLMVEPKDDNRQAPARASSDDIEDSIPF